MSFSIAHQAPAGDNVLYVRNAGNDLNAGTLASPLATISEALRRFKENPVGAHRPVVDLTGYTITSADEAFWRLPSGPWKYAVDFTRPGGLDNGKEDAFDVGIEFRADPTHVLDINIASTTLDPDTQLPVLNVSDTLVPNAHVGQFVWQGLAVQGEVLSNTASTITISSYTTSWSGAAALYEQSCVIDQPVNILFDTYALFNGIKFTGANKLWLFGSNWSIFSRCHFSGVDVLLHTGGYHQFFDSYHTGGNFRSDGAAYTVWSACFDNVSLGGHGSGGFGIADWSACRINNCTPVGEGNHESATPVELTGCHITNAKTVGVHRQSPYASRLSSVKIDNSAGDAISISAAGGYHKMNKVTGTGNGGVGLRLRFGAQCQDQGENTVTGTGGDVVVGADTTTWAAVDALTSGQCIHDGAATYPHFCRIFV